MRVHIFLWVASIKISFPSLQFPLYYGTLVIKRCCVILCSLMRISARNLLHMQVLTTFRLKTHSHSLKLQIPASWICTWTPSICNKNNAQKVVYSQVYVKEDYLEYTYSTGKGIRNLLSPISVPNFQYHVF